MITIRNFGIFIFLCYNAVSLLAETEEDESVVTFLDHVGKLKSKYRSTLDGLEDMLRRPELDRQLSLGFLLKQGQVHGRVDYTTSNMIREIPLGSLHLLQLDDGYLFFQDLKLAGQTVFTPLLIKLDFIARTLVVSLDLRDLAIVGAYEVAKWTTPNQTDLLCTNDHGEIQIEFQKSNYDAILKLLVAGETLVVTEAASVFKSIDQMININSKFGENIVEQRSLNEMASIMHQLRTSLDKWMIQYMNGLLSSEVYLKGSISPNQAKFAEYIRYSQEYDFYVTNFVDSLVAVYAAKAGKHPRLPMERISLATRYNVNLVLENGYLESLPSLYRKDAFIHSENNETITIHAVLAFSRLKVIYDYTANIPQQKIPLKGNIIFDLDDTELRLILVLVKATKQVASLFGNTIRTEAYSITVEGPLDRYYTVVRHLLIHQVLAIIDQQLSTNLRIVELGKGVTENKETDAAVTTESMCATWKPPGSNNASHIEDENQTEKSKRRRIVRPLKNRHHQSKKLKGMKPK